MSAMASQITSLTIVYSASLFRRRSKKHQSSASLAFVRGISLVSGEFPSQRPSNAECASIWWRHHAKSVTPTAVSCIDPLVLIFKWKRLPETDPIAAGRVLLLQQIHVSTHVGAVGVTDLGVMLLWIGHSETNFGEKLIKIQNFSLKKTHLKRSSAKCLSVCLRLNVLGYHLTFFIITPSTFDMELKIDWELNVIFVDGLDLVYATVDSSSQIMSYTLSHGNLSPLCPGEPGHKDLSY